MKFPILGQMPREGKRWQIGEQTARMLEEQGKLEIVDGIVKKAVYPEDELEKRKFAPFWSHLRADEVGTAQTGKEELNKIMNKAVGFDTVKPVNLIKEILCHLPKESVVLDFFAGFRVIIVTVANSLGNIRVFELLPKLKTKKYGWCIA